MGSEADPLPTDPFALGVASGDALPDSIVLWTRLAPEPTSGQFGMDGVGSVEVTWEIATDPALLGSAPVASGVALAEPRYAWSVHVDVTGLRPGQAYYYRFSTAGWTSRIGRTRTCPTPAGQDMARFAVLSCQNLARAGGGLFHLNGVADLAGRDDVDFAVYLGDYIYEFGRPGHVPSRACITLQDYRVRYGQYKSRASLKALHERLPVYAVPDDHEVYDGVLGGDVGMSASQGERFDNAIQAYWENMPLRGGPPQRDSSSGRLGLQLRRRVRWGRHLDLLLVDDRQHRTADTTILGSQQMDWLLDAVRGSRATWTAIGSGVPLSWFPAFAGAADKWTGYDTDRSALTDALAARLEARPHRGFNPVVLSGDTHRGVVTHVRQRQNAESALVATEFVGPPVTSNSSADFAAVADSGAFRAQYAYEENGIQSYRGYLHCAATSDHFTASYVLGTQVDRADGTVETLAQWRVTDGSPVGDVRQL